MITSAELFSEILRNPEDDALRLIYADRLDEEGEHARAEFIRVQMALAALPQPKKLTSADSSWDAELIAMNEEDPHHERLLRRSLTLLGKNRKRWVPSHAQRWLTGGSFQKGFLTVVALRLLSWLRHGPELVLTTPLVEVRLLDRAPLLVEPPPDEWSRYRWYFPEYPELLSPSDPDMNHWLPPELIPYFPDLAKAMVDSTVLEYPSHRGANEALSRALLNWAHATAPGAVPFWVHAHEGDVL